MEIYDTANRLADELKNSNQFKQYKESKEKLFSDPKKKEMIEEFEKLKQEVQLMEIKKQANQEVDENEKKIKMAKLYNVLVENNDIKEFFDYEIAFNKLMYDVNKIIGDAIKELM